MAHGWLTLGKITGVFGVKGWLKVYSFTDPVENILSYPKWRLEKNGVIQNVEIDSGRRHKEGIVVHIVGIDDREQALLLRQTQVQVLASQLPVLESDDFYWYQLQGLTVYQVDAQGEPTIKLGLVDHLLETGANDVLVVKAPRTENESGTDSEVLIPYLVDDVVKEVDLEKGRVLVDWDVSLSESS